MGGRAQTCGIVAVMEEAAEELPEGRFSRAEGREKKKS
jgi:hypothetical protein